MGVWQSPTFHFTLQKQAYKSVTVVLTQMSSTIVFTHHARLWHFGLPAYGERPLVERVCEFVFSLLLVENGQSIHLAGNEVVSGAKC